jgi:hypothetical protein
MTTNCSANFVEPRPIGVTQPDDSDRRSITRVTGGDTIVIHTRAKLLDGKDATPENSLMQFVLYDQRFDESAIWSGAWRRGVELVDGIVEIKIPDDIADTLRRGSYLYSLFVTDLLGNNRRTVIVAYLLVEYQPTSPHHNIPYHDD